MRMLHTADLHFSRKPDKLAETIRTAEFVLDRAEVEEVDAIAVAGDTFDEHDGPIKADSDCVRAGIAWVERAANIAPVLIVRGTLTHDRGTLHVLRRAARFPIVIAEDVSQIVLARNFDQSVEFRLPADGGRVFDDEVAIFSLVPSLDKSYLMASFDAGSVREGNMEFRSAIHDLFAGIGLVHERYTAFGVPAVLITHGMLTGATFSSGQMAVGEDLEFSLTDLHASKSSYVALGHVHKFQSFPGNVVYSGSPGRMNFGETEDKGFVLVDFDGPHISRMEFVLTPARQFCLEDVAWESADKVMDRAREVAKNCNGAEVRFRVGVPEEDKASIDRAVLERMFQEAGAVKVRLEIQIIPKQRQRMVGITKVESLASKLDMWLPTVGESASNDLMTLASAVEGVTASELLDAARQRILAPAVEEELREAA